MALSWLWFYLLSTSAALPQMKATEAVDMPSEDKFANEAYFGYDEGLGGDVEEEEEDQSVDDGLLTKDDLHELQAIHFLYMNISNRALLPAVPNGETVVTLGNTYRVYSHDQFSVLRYANRFFRSFNLARDSSVNCIEIYCPYFRLQKSFRCIKDRLISYLPPYTNGRRFCGKRHGLRLKYCDDVRLVFKTDRRRRRNGFFCRVTSTPYPAPPTCCEVIPVQPSPRQVVTACSDLLPGFDYCQCTELSTGLCLTCSFCENCHLEFLAAHDFSQTQLYIYFSFPCNNCSMNLATNSYGYNQYVAGYVNCLNSNPNVILPTYPPTAYVVALFCPPPSSFDVCAYFQSLISGSGRRLSLENGNEGGKRNLVKPCTGNVNLVVLEANIPNCQPSLLVTQLPGRPIYHFVDRYHRKQFIVDTFDFPSLSDLECYGRVTITGAQCNNFNQGGPVDLTVFTNIQIIDLHLCTSNLSCGSVIVNSSLLQQVTVSLPKAASCNSSCILNNLATPTSPPTVTCPSSTRRSSPQQKRLGN